MDSKRRHFLVQAASLAGWALVSGCPREPKTPLASGTNSPSLASNSHDVPVPDTPTNLEPVIALKKRGMLIGPGGKNPKTQWLAIADLDRMDGLASGQLKPTLIPISFKGHAVVPHPVERDIVAVFEKWGPGACEIDLRAQKVIRPITTVAERQFYGHGAWSGDGKLLYAVESEDRNKGSYNGVIAIRDRSTLELKGEFPTYGKLPHDCHLVDQGRTLAITNGGDAKPGGEPGCVTFVDIASQKLLEKVMVSGYLAGHVAITGRSRKGGIAVGSTPYEKPELGEESFKKIPGALSLRAAGASNLSTISQPEEVTKRMLGETLSVAIHEGKGIVGATNPAGGVCTFWDFNSGKHLRTFELPVARGIAVTLDQKHFVVTYEMNTSCVLIDVETLQAEPAMRFAPSYVSGSHFITYDWA